MNGITFFFLLSAATVLAACTAQDGAAVAPQSPNMCTTAQEVIDRHFEALGGREKIREIDTLTLKGSVGSALLPSGQEITLYLKKPDKYKQVGSFRITLCNGETFVYNNGGEKVPLSKENLENLKYRIGFFHNGFSLLHWKDSFPSAELEEIKAYGPVKQYMIRFPTAENGHDLIAYIDADTFLIDRLVYIISHPEAGTLKVVNSLRDYEEYHGLWLPSRLVFDKVGWEEGPLHFVFEEVELNPPIENALFEGAEIDFGTVVCEGETIRGEIWGEMDGWLLTNIRVEDITTAGIKDTDWLNLKVGDTQVKVKYLNNIQRSAAEIKPEQVYLCRYPISGFPRLQIVYLGADTLAKIPCEKGDSLSLSKTANNENQ